MKVSRPLMLPAMALAALSMSACALLPEQPAVDRSWFLMEIAEVGPAENAGAPVELVSVRVAPAFAGKGLVYRVAPYRYEADFYNEWFLNPREHVEQILRERWTRERSPVTLVADARVDPRAVRLDVLVTALHGDLHQGGAGFARVGLRVFAQGQEGSRLWDLERAVPMDSRTPESLVAALSAGIAGLLDELERWLSE